MTLIFQNHRRAIIELFIITTVCLPIIFLTVTTQSANDVNALDNTWYLTRSYWLWQGQGDDFFVYGMAYPIVVGLFREIVGDYVIAGMLTNTLIWYLIVIGTYTLGRQLYPERRVAGFAAIIIATSYSLFWYVRLFFATEMFIAELIWIIVLFHILVYRRTLWAAAALGVLLAVALYTRLEAVSYTPFIVIAGWIIFRETRNRSLALRLVTISAGTFLLCASGYILNYLWVQRNIDPEFSASVMGVFTLLNRTPIEWNIVWVRLTDLIASTLVLWRLSTWLLVIAAVIWCPKQHRYGNYLCAGLTIFTLVVSFLLSIWPFPAHVSYHLPFVALILGSLIWHVMELLSQWKPLVVLLLLALIIPGIVLAFMYARTPPFAYRSSDLAEQGQAVDNWLAERGWQDKRIFDLCRNLALFSRARLFIIYRLISTTGWNSAERLIPTLQSSGDLVLICGNDIRLDFPDWYRYLASPSGVLAPFEEVGRVGRFVFYRVNDT